MQWVVACMFTERYVLSPTPPPLTHPPFSASRFPLVIQHPTEPEVRFYIPLQVDFATVPSYLTKVSILILCMCGFLQNLYAFLELHLCLALYRTILDQIRLRYWSHFVLQMPQRSLQSCICHLEWRGRWQVAPLLVQTAHLAHSREGKGKRGWKEGLRHHTICCTTSRALGGSKTLRIPAWGGGNGSCLIDYVPVVHKMLEERVDSIVQSYVQRKEYVAAMLSIFGASVLEYNTENFKTIAFLFEYQGFSFITQGK